MEQLSLSEAKRLSLIKWEALRDNPELLYFEVIDTLPMEVKKLEASCGFCERWDKSPVYSGNNCHLCEFGKKAGTCYHSNSLFRNFMDSQLHSKAKTKIAQQIINVINSIEYENNQQ